MGGVKRWTMRLARATAITSLMNNALKSEPFLWLTNRYSDTASTTSQRRKR